MKKSVIAIILLVIMVGAFSYRVKIKNLWLDMTKEQLPEAIEYQIVGEVNDDQRSMIDEQILESELQNPNYEIQNSNNITLPSSFNLDVPFTSQAPLADWNETFKEACEEASALTVHYFYQNKEFTPSAATEEILKMVNWQLDNWGGHFDLTASQTAELIKSYLGYQKVEVINNPTVEEIKSQIYQKRPVIVPAAGRLLNNPYFRTPGPIYHMLVIKGYTETQFITNDPGTKRGENFFYDYEVIMNAMHDWHEEDILRGGKKIIVIYPAPL